MVTPAVMCEKVHRRLRRDIVANRKKRAKSDSLSEREKLFTLIVTQTEMLQQFCSHELIVVMCSEYKGSYSNDHEDQHKEHRKCIVCGFNDCAWDEDFKTLNKEPIGRFEYGTGYTKLPNGSMQGVWDRTDVLDYDLDALVMWVKETAHFAFTKA